MPVPKLIMQPKETSGYIWKTMIVQPSFWQSHKYAYFSLLKVAFIKIIHMIAAVSSKINIEMIKYIWAKRAIIMIDKVW